jgi:regulatory protein RepA
MIPGIAKEWTDGAFVPDESGRELPPIEDAATLIASEITLPPDVIEGVAHLGGKIVLGGPSKAFKTHTLVDMAVSVATGSEWIGFQTKRGRVLFSNFEIPSAYFTMRILTICKAKGVTLEVGYLDVWNLRGYAADSATLLPLLLKCMPRGRYLLSIIDPSYKLLGGRDENAAGDVASLLNDFERLAVQTGAAVAFGAHYSKGNQSRKESIDRIGGSGVFARDPDSILNFTGTNAKTVSPLTRPCAIIRLFCPSWCAGPTR